jgi:hypothetical protein
MKLKKLAAVMAVLWSTGAMAQVDLGFTSSGLTGWTLSPSTGTQSPTGWNSMGYGANVVSAMTNYTPGGGNTWTITPYSGNYMASLQPTGSTMYATMVSSFGLSTADKTAIQTFLNTHSGGGQTSPTNAAYMYYPNLTLTAGTKFTVAWNFVATDYVPWNDTSLTSLVPTSGGATPKINGYTQDYSVLGAINPNAGNWSVGSYGSSGWQVATYEILTDGTYTLGFGDFNLGDTALSPILLVSGTQGNTLKNGVAFGPIVSNDPAIQAAVDAVVTPPAPSGPVAVNNPSGTTATNPSGTTTLDVTNAGTYTNDGTNGAVTNTGTFTNNGTTGAVTNTSGTFTNTATGTTGNVTNAGTFNNAGTTGSVTNSGTFNNNTGGSTGAVNNTGVFTNNGVVTTVTYNNYLINNNGSITGNVANGGAFNNYATGTVGGTVTSTQDSGVGNAGTINSVVLQSNALLNNAGTVGTVSTDTSTTVNNAGTITNGFTNNGTVNNTGTLADVVNNNILNNNTGGTTGSVTNTGTVTNSGTTGAVTNNATATFTNTGNTGDVNNSGTFVMNGGSTGNITNTGNFDLSAGTTGDINNSSVAVITGGTTGNITNTGNVTYTGGTVGGISNTGTFNVTGAGTTISLGNYSQSGTGVTVINGNQQIAVNGTASLSGNLTVLNSPVAYGKYNYLSAGSVTGTYDTLTLNPNPSPLGYGLIYTPTGVGLEVTPSAAYTQQGVDRIGSSLSEVNNLQMALVNGALGFDCSTFGNNGYCVSTGVNATNTSAGQLTSGTVTLGKRVTPNWRVGVVLSETFNTLNVGGVQSNTPLPVAGLYANWNMSSKGYGLGVQNSIARSSSNLTITRTGTVYSEGATGKTTSNGLAYQSKATYTIPMSPKTNVTPYIGLRYTQLNTNGYTETGAQYPLTYNSLNQNTTDALVGVSASHQFGALTGFVNLGLTKNLSYDAGTLSGSSKIIGLNSFSTQLPGSHYTSAGVGAGVNYDLGRDQYVGASVGWQQKSLLNTNISTFGVTYTKGF